MPVYNPGKFASLYVSAIGQRLWDFLNRPENILRLETASELSKPAVEGIGEPLLKEFGKEVLEDRVKQMIGHMVRQILEQRGWVLDQGNVTVQSVPFIKASRYRQPAWVNFHAFRNKSDRSDIAITDRRQNPSLPADEHWTYYATFASPIKAAVGFGIHDISELRQQVQAKGYHRIQVKRMLRRA